MSSSVIFDLGLITRLPNLHAEKYLFLRPILSIDHKMKEKNFESCLYTPMGFHRNLKPVSNADLQHLSVSILNKTSSIDFKPGNIEVISEEITKVQATEEFSYTETLYRVVIPCCDNMYAEAASSLSIGENTGWQRIRDATLKRIMEFDSTMKLWDTTRKNSPLVQMMPHTIFHDFNSPHYFWLSRLDVPMNAKVARREFRRLIKTGENNIIKPGAKNILDNWDFDECLRSRLLRAIRIASNITPRLATNSTVTSNLVRHSLKTELLRDIEVNAYNMGLVVSDEDSDFRNCIKFFQEPAEKFVPLSFITTYKTSLYATMPECLSPANIIDSESRNGLTKLDTAVEFNFLVQNLVTAWPKKYDKLHDFTPNTAVKDLLPGTVNVDLVEVRKSNSYWGKILKNEDVLPCGQGREKEWSGKKCFEELPMVNGNRAALRPRINAVSGVDE